MKKINDELIAEFMKCSKPPNSDFDYFWKGEFFKVYNAKWNKSWDWLMPVVEKIEDLGYAFEIIQDNATIFDHWSKNNLNEIIPICGDTKISATYQAVVQFIHWYNQQKS